MHDAEGQVADGERVPFAYAVARQPPGGAVLHESDVRGVRVALSRQRDVGLEPVADPHLYRRGTVARLGAQPDQAGRPLPAAAW